jgi:uncharacterized protein YjiS (DUF1127 family)
MSKPHSAIRSIDSSRNEKSALAPVTVLLRQNFRRPTMLDHLIARFRTWQLQLTTIRLLDNTDDRLLADLGIERANIAAIAKANREKADREWSVAHQARPAALSPARASCKAATANG